MAESEAGRARFNALREEGRKHPIEQVGAELRSMMPWISAGKQKVADVRRRRHVCRLVGA